MGRTDRAEDGVTLTNKEILQTTFHVWWIPVFNAGSRKVGLQKPSTIGSEWFRIRCRLRDLSWHSMSLRGHRHGRFGDVRDQINWVMQIRQSASVFM